MEQIFSWVLERSLGISVVLLAVMLLQPFLHRRYRPQLNCLVWTALALCLLIPFSLPRTKQAVVTIDWESLIARQEEQMNGAAGTEPEQLSQAEGLPVQSAQRRPVQWLPAIWLAGAAMVLVGQGGIYLATRKKLLRWSTAVEEPRTKQLLSRCQQELGMQEQVRLMRCCLLDTPMLMGLWRPCILLPEVELEEQQLRYVLLHELSHRRRRDLWLKFLLLVAKAVHWFNPLVWWMARRASADIEVACDADVLRLHDTKEERREYGALILYFIQLSRGRAIPLTTNFSEKGQIMRRFQEMMNTSKKRVGLLLFALICAAAVGSTALVSLNVQAEEEVDSIVGESGSVELGDPSLPDDSLNDYRSFGVSYQASTGHWMYEGRPIHILYDEDHYTFCDNGVSDGVSLTVFRNAGGNIERLVPAEGKELEAYINSYQPIQVQYDLGPGAEWVWPVPSTHEVSWPYGLRYGDTDFHTGLDIGDYSQEIYGEPVVAAADGTVAMVSEDWTPGRGYGMYLVIEHENGFATLYGHLSAIDVEEGDTVKAGEQIGQIGATSFATGPHLHFEVRVNGQHLDPAEYLPVGEE